MRTPLLLLKPPVRAGWRASAGALLAMMATLLVAWATATPARGQARQIPLSELRSGLTFASGDVRAQQADDFQNPAMLWVDRGQRLWSEPPASGAPACQGCHGAVASMKGVSARLPRVDAATGQLRDLTRSINACRTERQRLPALAHESDDMLGLTALVAQQSRGLPMTVSIDGPAARYFEAGQALYFRRLGQVDLACTDCHDRNWGRHLLTDVISQGQPNAYPIYRLEWQTVGSLHRRFRSCLFGVRARMLPQGSDEYLALELYLAWRAQGLSIESPGVRR